MSEPESIPAGTVVAGKLRVVRLLGMGGMGAVYEVEHELTRHRRALKLLHAEMLQHPSVVARFVREASAAGHIGNPHIVETFDAGVLEGGEPYIVMEMLQGETLADRLEKVRRLPLPELVDVLRQACDAVQAAHDAGIVHRDLKPENLFLVDRDGKAFVKVLDFGVSKFDPALTGADANTKEGSMVGTPYYMSPEQVNGDKDVDARTDLYALGVILYQCASGSRPFQSDQLPKLAVLIHEGNPMPLSERRPDLPGGFVDVVHRAMARDRDQRFPTARELGAALEPFGAIALDATMLEKSAVRNLSRPPPQIAIARSERPPEPTPSPHDATAGKPPGLVPLTAPGSALSVAPLADGAGKTSRTRSGPMAVVAIISALVAAAVVVVVGRGSGGPASPGPGAATVAPLERVTPEPPATTAPSASSVALVPLASATPTAAVGTKEPAATTPPPGAGHGAAPTPSASGKPPASRAEQRGLAGDNPFK